MNIKVGDRVKVIGQSKYRIHLLIGKEGTVKKVESNLVEVKLDGVTNAGCYSGYFDFYPEELLILDEFCKGCNGECYGAYHECESCPYELRDVDNTVLEKFNNIGLTNHIKSTTRKDYKMYYNNVKIKIGNKIYYPDTVDWKQNPDAFPELKISTRISPYNLDTTSNLSITNVIFNPPATIVFWSDKTKTVVKCDPKEEYDPEKGISMAICKKLIGDNKRDYYNVFLHWIKKYEKQRKEIEEDEIDDLLDNGGDLEDD